MSKIKIGIDVGGTFTHAVAIDTGNLSIVGKSCVMTTHRAAEGVARGVVDSMQQLISHTGIKPEDVVMIAHSTTQATNALLEGDVAAVGILVLGKGLEGRIGFRQVSRDVIELAPGKELKHESVYLDLNDKPDREKISQAIQELSSKGAEVMVATMVYGVDDPAPEKQVARTAAEMGFPATAASDISKLYGLRVRTRTAVINAAMMPKMLETANMTEKAVRESGMSAPLMIMRSDGGIMDIQEMRKRPILTMLSGPAAGVAAALMYANISDGIFVEVGGTSSDISVIRNGKPQVKSAQIGGNRLYLRALDVRTLGIAGGSVPRISKNSILDVGPRSAHIANVKYVSFDETYDFSQIEIGHIRPSEGDPDDYMTLRPGSSAELFTLTPTGASNYLRLVKDKGHSLANLKALESCFKTLSEKWEVPPEFIAERILKLSAEKIRPVIKQLIREYKLDESLIHLVGGGGGAPAIVPFTATYLGMEHSISKNTEVISAIGVALGIIRDTVEKTVLNPTTEDILSVRRDAAASVQTMGADPDTIEVMVEVDAKNKRVIATATGSGEMKSREIKKEIPRDEELLHIAAASMKSDSGQCQIEGSTGALKLISAQKEKRSFFGLVRHNSKDLRVINREGVIRLQQNNASVNVTTRGEAKTALSSLVGELTSFGDAGALMPDIFVICQGRIIDMTGLVTPEQMQSMLDIEIRSVPEKETCIITGAMKS